MAGESVRCGLDIFTSSMRRSYEYLGMVMFTSLLWFIIAAIPAGFLVSFSIQVPSVVSVLLVLLEVTFLAAPVTAAVYSVTSSLVHGEDVAAREIWYRFRQHYLLTVKVVAVMLVLIAILVIDVIFFLNSKIKVVQWLSVPWLYLVLFWVMMTTYVFPLVVYQRVSWLKVLQRAALLTIDNMVVTILVMLQALLLIGLGTYLVLPVPLLLAGMVSLLQATALSEVLNKYGETPQTDTG